MTVEFWNWGKKNVIIQKKICHKLIFHFSLQNKMFSAGAPFDTKYSKPIFKQMLSPGMAGCRARPGPGTQAWRGAASSLHMSEEGTCHSGCMRNPLSSRSQTGCVLCISTGQSLILAMYVPWAYAVVQPKSVLPWQPCVTWCHTCYISKSLYIAFATKHTLQYVT